MRLVQARSITFDKRQPFFKEPTDNFDYVESGDRDDSGGYDSDDDGADAVAGPLVLPGPILACADGDGGTRDGGTTVQVVRDVQPAVLQIIYSEQPVQQPVEQPVQRPVEQPEQSTPRSGRVRRKPAWMEDYVLNDNFNNEAHLCMAAVVSSTDVPTSIQEALDDPNWKVAMKASSILWSTTKLGNLFQNQRTGKPSAASGICCQTRCRWRDRQVQGAICGKGVHSNLRSALQRDPLPNRATYISAIFMGNRSAAEVFGVPDGQQDGVLECSNRRGDLYAATGGVRECGRGRTTYGVPVAEIVVWAETVW